MADFRVGVEEVGRGEERVADLVRVRIEAALLSEGFELRVWRFGFGHRALPGGGSYV